ncbi:Maf family protein [Mitsuokella jalaludinii]|uniref:Maf family protein n=1 Tax=Mitsuokella jalaludinii TaxID=187979 RepID=UPI003D03ED41
MFILASASPRRRELLQQIDASFEVKVSSVEEVTGGNLAPAEIVVENAVRKAKAVAEAFQGDAVLGADTIVFLDGRVYGKPKDGEEAKAMLRALAGREHEVATGIAWVHAGEVFTDVETTRVFFAPLTEEAIDAYVKTGEPLDKAGAYAIQGRAAQFIESIEGSFSNVVGLPLYAVCRLAGKAGVNLYDNHGSRSTDGGATA